MDQNVRKEINANSIKCRKCRVVLFDETEVQNSHGQKVTRPTAEDSESGETKDKQMSNLGVIKQCSSDSDLVYIADECLPDWLSKYLEKGQWIKGKIFCPNCTFKIGSYDFVSGLKCSCPSTIVTPPIHLVKSKVDVLNNSCNLTTLTTILKT